MTNEQIDKFLTEKNLERPIQISFKTRKGITGLFLKLPDYGELRSKNFWRVVSETHFEDYKKSKDPNLARIFNGSEMTKLSL
jgi:hypothetical protein